MQNYKKIVITGILQANYYALECVLVCFIKLNRVQARDYNNKKRLASSSYGMLTGSVMILSFGALKAIFIGPFIASFLLTHILSPNHWILNDLVTWLPFSSCTFPLPDAVFSQADE